MRQKKYYFAFLLFPLLFCYCSEITEVGDKPQIKIDDNQSIPVIPDSIISKANDFIISKVGGKFFNSYIKYDSENSRYFPDDSFCIQYPSTCAEYLLNPYYYFAYKFNIPEKEFVDEIIELVTDTLGNVVPSRDVYGIPKCSNNDCWDNFLLIEKDEAISLAKNNGLEKGIIDWSISFHFYAGKFENYVWEVSNTLYQSSSESGGKTLLIDANSGEIVQSSNWISKQ